MPGAVDAAARGGWDAVGLWVDRQWTDDTTVRVRRALADSGLIAADVEVLWIKPGAPDDEHRRLLEIGAAVGARNALCVSSDPDRGATIARYAALCAYARPLGVRVPLEFGLFAEVKTIHDALERPRVTAAATRRFLACPRGAELMAPAAAPVPP